MTRRRIRCFLIEPSDQADTWLRRYTDRPKACPKRSYGHDASLRIERIDYPLSLKQNGEGRSPTDEERRHPAWPTRCSACDAYAFEDSDTWQVHIERLYRRTDTGELVRLNDAPPGSMYYADWYPASFRPHSPDGRSLVVVTPAGPWVIDGRSSNGSFPWRRTGTPPEVTVTPSIDQGSYHGWLRNGWLED